MVQYQYLFSLKNTQNIKYQWYLHIRVFHFKINSNSSPQYQFSGSTHRSEAPRLAVLRFQLSVMEYVRPPGSAQGWQVHRSIGASDTSHFTVLLASSPAHTASPQHGSDRLAFIWAGTRLRPQNTFSSISLQYNSSSSFSPLLLIFSLLQISTSSSLLHLSQRSTPVPARHPLQHLLQGTSCPLT